MQNPMYDSSLISDKLNKLQSTQNSIQQTSSIFLDLGQQGFFKELIQEWYQYFQKFKESEKKLISLLYLANDILQKSKGTQANPFVTEFKDTLIKVGDEIAASRSYVSLKNECKRVFNILNERKIFGQKLNITRFDQQPVNKENKETPKDPKSDNYKKDDKIDAEKSLLDKLPENLPNIPQELVNLSQNIKECSKFKDKTEEHQSKLYNMQEYKNNSLYSAEITLELKELQRTLTLQNKYRVLSLKSYQEVLNLIDKQHMKTVIELKLLLQKIDNLESLKAQSEKMATQNMENIDEQQLQRLSQGQDYHKSYTQEQDENNEENEENEEIEEENWKKQDNSDNPDDNPDENPGGNPNDNPSDNPNVNPGDNPDDVTEKYDSDNQEQVSNNEQENHIGNENLNENDNDKGNEIENNIASPSKENENQEQL